MKINYASLLLILVLLSNVAAQVKPVLADIDRIRLAEAFKLGEALEDRVWTNWHKAPFAVLLVAPENEFLVRHPQPSKDFTLLGYDPLLQSNVYVRQRTQQVNFLATFPAVGGVPTIVIGQAENTQAKTSTPWIVTLLHEHFHQLQDAQPNSYREVDALNLARGDRTGIWMLNYAFPYDSPDIEQQFAALSKLLLAALQTESKSELSTKLAAYLEARRQLQKLLNADDYKYLSFQLWKEGIARYTEYRIARLAAAEYTPSKEFRQLKDFTSFESVAQALLNKTIAELATLKLENCKRVAFYPIGAGEGLLLDKVNPQWQTRYFTEKYNLENYFNAAK